ncbi:putative glycosyltransferase RF_0543 [Planktothrix tepida]|uniref:Uncharacterized protein n=1 Tax=Planktothrix tepida PCC 9214 TaxID=671072 RepID=A0A1J1LRC3_9CYAN|nr:glycosyltransferase [Planktothrix tepida]CAD5961935.1 putative glycosyltransferase RF_0543 [Planktothrix tepida]CUR34790.1 hypothetical protein PL9214650229 [Planktothrix tepida PCC 9214]
MSQFSSELTPKDIRSQAIEHLHQFLGRGGETSYLRMGDGELGYLMNSRDVKLTGLDPCHYQRLVIAYQNCSYLDLCMNQDYNRQNFPRINLSIASQTYINNHPKTGNLIRDWTYYKLHDYLLGRRCLIVGAEAAILEKLYQDQDYRKLTQKFWHKENSVFFLQPRDQGNNLKENLDLIKLDILVLVLKYNIDTVFISLGGCAKILCYEIAQQLQVTTIDWGSILRGLAYSGSRGDSYTFDYCPYFVRFPFPNYMQAVEKAHPELDQVSLLSIAQAQLKLELNRKVPKIGQVVLDFCRENIQQFQKGLEIYRTNYVSKIPAEHPEISKVNEFEDWINNVYLPEKELAVIKDSNQRLLALKDKHKGQRCVIIGNGPSLNQMDLSFLKNEICFGLNKIYLGFEKWGFIPTYYVSVNRLVIEQNAEEILNIPCPKFLSNRGIPYLLPQDDIFFIKTNPPPDIAFSPDPTQGLNEGSTVTYIAMQLAYYMGFETVILIGVDHHFVTQGQPHKEVISPGDDPNHFHPDYFGKGTKWHLPDLPTSEHHYKIAYDYFKINNRQIIDATLDGQCQVFPKQDYRELFCKSNPIIITGKIQELPKVTVVVTANHPLNTIRKTVTSILNQKYPNTEIVVVDQGSEDHISTVLQSEWDQIRYIQQEKLGVLAARNQGLQVAQGEFILFLGGDSCLSPGGLTQLMTFVKRESTKTDMIFAGKQISQGDTWVNTTPWEDLPDLDDIHIWKLPNLWKPFSDSIIVLRCSMLNLLGGFDRQFYHQEAATIDVVLRLGLRNCSAIWFHRQVCYNKELNMKIMEKPQQLSQDLERVVNKFFADTELKDWMRPLESMARDNAMAYSVRFV